jgi:transposase-like protein
LLNQAIELWRKDAPKLAEEAQENLAEGFAVFRHSSSQHVWLRTTSGLQSINPERKRRTRVAAIFPNPFACLRLLSALLANSCRKNVALSSRLN